jgi:hypothetical protein
MSGEPARRRSLRVGEAYVSAEPMCRRSLRAGGAYVPAPIEADVPHIESCPK